MAIFRTKTGGVALLALISAVEAVPPSPSTTGALSIRVLAPSIPALPPAPDSFKYPADGKLHGPQPAPYTPNGGISTNGSAPGYRVQSDLDYQSLALALYHQWIELDLFHWGLARFSDSEFDAYGIDAEDRSFLRRRNQPEPQIALGCVRAARRAEQQLLYVTSTNVREPSFAAWVSQLNRTYSLLLSVSAASKTAYTIQPNVSTWAGDLAINGTMFLALTDLDLYVTPYNLTMINPHVAALAVYKAL